MVNGSCVITVDAHSHGLAITSEHRSTEEKNDLLESILDDFTTDQFKSLFFLLIDYMSGGEDDFFSITKQTKSKLKEMFKKTIGKHSNELLVELLGELKMYKHLKALDTCFHIFKNCQGAKFNKIDDFWKMLFLLCEEISDSEFVLLKDSVPSTVRDQIVVAEDYFFWAFKRNIFSKKDVSNLLETFTDHQHPACSKIIQDFQANLNKYPVKIPTHTSHSGLALIFNFDVFDRELHLPKRKGSDIDVNSLKNLWNEFGFEIKIFSNLTCEETFHELKNCATSDHSDYDVFVCCFLSHGKLNSIISSDGFSMPISNLVAEVIDHSESFDTKPKLFFIQACQGPHIQQGVGKPIYCINSAQESIIKECTKRTETPPIVCDVLLAVSSIDGYVSFREPENGSWFINALCNVMKTSGDKKSILDVMSEVNNHVRKKSTDFGPIRMATQIVKFTSTLDKILILKKRLC